MAKTGVNLLKSSARGKRENGSHVDISEERGVRYLHLGNDAVQSAMRMKRRALFSCSP